MDAEAISLALAFGAGMLAFLSPCILPLVPVYVAQLADVALESPANSPSTSSGHSVNWRSFFHALSFVLGFSAVFTAMGAAVGLLGSFVIDYVPLLRQVAGIVLVIFGLHLLGLFRIPFLYRELRVGLDLPPRAGYLRSAAIGAAFSIGWTPCVGPVLGGILGLAATSQTALQGTYLLAAFSLGLGIPFLAVGLAVSTVSGWLKRLNRFLPLISVISGILLIIIGVLIFTDKLILLNGLFDFGQQVNI